MDATKVKVLWKVDQDTIDYGEYRYDISYIEQHANGNLEVMLDTVPIENRLYCYTNNSNEWAVIDYNSRRIEASSEIMEVLTDIQNTIARLTK